jgi:5-methylcytosine-specific restriction endonuclease McrA
MDKVNQTCTKCGLNKPIERFYFIKRSNSHDTRCKRCVAAYIKSRHEASGGQILRDSYQRRKARGYTQKPYKEKSEHEKALIYAAVKRYREKNKDRVNEEQRQGTQMRRSLAYRKAWHLIVAHYGGKCLRCGKTERLCFDHVDPLSLGGPNSLANGQPLCIGCNTSKGATDRNRDYRPDFGAWILELGRLNPWLTWPLMKGRWHIGAGVWRARDLRREAAKDLVIPGQIAQADRDGSGFQRDVLLDAGQIAHRQLLNQLRSDLSDAQ